MANELLDAMIDERVGGGTIDTPEQAIQWLLQASDEDVTGGVFN